MLHARAHARGHAVYGRRSGSFRGGPSRLARQNFPPLPRRADRIRSHHARLRRVCRRQRAGRRNGRRRPPAAARLSRWARHPAGGLRYAHRKTPCSATSGGTARRSSCTSIRRWPKTGKGIGHVPNSQTGSRTGRPIPCWPALPPARNRKSTISRATTCIPNWTPYAAISSNWNGKTASPPRSRPEARRNSCPCSPHRKTARLPPFPKLRPAGMPTTRIR